MLYLFDLDGTLISSYMDRDDRAFDTWQVLPGRIARLARLRADGHQIGIVTNQAGVAFGHVTEAQVASKLIAALTALQLPLATPVRVCYAHEQAPLAQYRDPAELARRKPEGTMLEELKALRPAQAAQGVAYVGDRDEDRQAAANADVDFYWADSFFGGADARSDL